ncbi:hypothetical protein VTN96DRAFT_6009 [Rasamsonia emersonii]|uniref:Rhomboid family protein n=1 Tax=Rasamsonia emersonii (strain ATCC 16479 / CBS 393.64 / IMI 116815) TaxID=1408163 RepID=A0A0F4YYT9_RASE3|nr:Rhomboid family protein [Rasamsonia emersonii CBS 393.64]KKA23462.1 Rhomboid family protein [Rasamsonia emersonii CBS 393.64]
MSTLLALCRIVATSAPPGATANVHARFGKLRAKERSSTVPPLSFRRRFCQHCLFARTVSPESLEMSNVFSIAWRISCPSGLRASPSSCLLPLSAAPAKPTLRPLCRLQRPYSSDNGRPVSPQGWGFSARLRRFQLTGPTNTVFSRSAQTQNSPPPPDSKPDQAPVEHGVPIRSQPLSAAEIKSIFGSSKVTPAMGNRILNVLQGRRLQGTLDLDLPADITRAVRPRTIENGLKWLRKNYPVDEDAAIMARIEREEREEEERIRRQAEELYRPQSGHWGAPLGEANDIYGKSVLKEFREKNEARLLAEEEKKRKEWLEGEAKEQEKIRMQLKKNTELQKFDEAAVIEARPRADPQERPVLAWIQKHHLRATNTDVDTSTMTTSRRIFPSLGVTILTIGLCYLFAETYQPPARKDRMWPDVPPAAATAIALLGANFAVFTLWRFWPPAWRMLNRYFISVPLYPHALSVVGSVFSHQQLRHLATNMIILWFIGVRLHDEIGRGNFLALYLATGVFGSMTSLAAHVLTRKLTVTSLGASGAIAGLVAAWCTLHANDKLTLWFLPREWQDTFSARGYVFLTGIVLFEAFSLVSPFKVAALDHWAHLGGYFSGAIWALWWKSKKEKEARKRQEEMSWLDRLILWSSR